MTKPSREAWDLFFHMFSDGDEVILLTDDDVLEWGRLHADLGGCVLTRPGGVRRQFWWDEVKLLARDGFPCRKLFGADGRSTIEGIDTTNLQASLRERLAGERIGSGPRICPRLVCEHSSFVVGDPFLIEDVEATLLNPGHSGDVWEGHPLQEVIVCQSGDGAVGYLYDVPTIYHWDGV